MPRISETDEKATNSILFEQNNICGTDIKARSSDAPPKTCIKRLYLFWLNLNLNLSCFSVHYIKHKLTCIY